MSNSENGQTKPETAQQEKTIRKGERYFRAFFCHGCQSCWDIDPENPDAVQESEHVLGSEDVTDKIQELIQVSKQLGLLHLLNAASTPSSAILPLEALEKTVGIKQQDLQGFLKAMVLKLLDNGEKGESWRELTTTDVVTRLYEEVREVEDANTLFNQQLEVTEQDARNVQQELIDVANFALFGFLNLQGFLDAEKANRFRIAFYTTWEGGVWRRWPHDVVLKKNDLPQPNEDGVILLCGYNVHSFKTTNGEEWDTRNGWRKLNGTQMP